VFVDYREPVFNLNTKNIYFVPRCLKKKETLYLSRWIREEQEEIQEAVFLAFTSPWVVTHPNLFDVPV
jgi:hypothetical protein